MMNAVCMLGFHAVISFRKFLSSEQCRKICDQIE